MGLGVPIFKHFRVSFYVMGKALSGELSLMQTGLVMMVLLFNEANMGSQTRPKT